jgi:hypothetical protein
LQNVRRLVVRYETSTPKTILGILQLAASLVLLKHV